MWMEDVSVSDEVGCRERGSMGRLGGVEKGAPLVSPVREVCGKERRRTYLAGQSDETVRSRFIRFGSVCRRSMILISRSIINCIEGM